MENEVKAPEVVEEVVEASVEPSVENTDAVVEPVVETEETTPAIPETASIEPEQVEEPVGTEEGIEEPSVEEPAGNEFKKEEDEKKKEESDDNSDDQSDDEDEEEKKKKSFELLQADFTALQEQYHLLEETNAALAAERDELLAFKAKIEDAEKDAMIEKFCFLSEEDKKDVIENKSKYTLEEIESKLSVICVRNRVNFNLDNNDKTDIKIEGAPVVTFSLNETGDSTPAWIRAVKNNIQK
jgi:hypothetical protein